jgi:hypothetical protein
MPHDIHRESGPEQRTTKCSHAIQLSDRDSAARSDLRAALSLAYPCTHVERGWRLWFADPDHAMSYTEVQT